MTKVTAKEEKTLQQFIVCGNQSEAYRKGFKTDNMKPATIHRKAHLLFKKENVRARLEELQNEVKTRNAITIDKIVNDLSNISNFDPMTMYDDNGTILPIHQMPEVARKMITKIKTYSKFSGTGENKKEVGEITEIHLVNTMDAKEKLMKHLGGYDKDKEKTQIIYTVSVTKDEVKEISNQLENDI
jgi:phage terminase small subunit